MTVTEGGDKGINLDFIFLHKQVHLEGMGGTLQQGIEHSSSSSPQDALFAKGFELISL